MTLAYRKKGSGPTILFIHGFCESKDIWQAFESRLSIDYQTIAVDLPGFGKSQANKAYQSVEAMAEEVKKVLITEGVTSCTIIGHSLGGYVALAFAEQFPEFLKGLCLFHSTAYPDSEEKKHTRNKTADFIEKKGIELFLESFIPPLFYEGRKPELTSLIESYRQLALQTPKATAVAVTKAMRDRPDRTHVLTKANYPIMFIAGKEDTAVPLETSKDQFFLPKDSTIHLLAQTGHMGMYEHETQTLAIIESFAKRTLVKDQMSLMRSISPPY